MNQESFFERVKKGLEEGIQFAQGKLSLRQTAVLERPPRLDARDVIEMRRRLNVSQGMFARILNVSAKTVQSWEQGIRKPSQAALRLLQMLDADPEAVHTIVYSPARISVNGRKARSKAKGARKQRRVLPVDHPE